MIHFQKVWPGQSDSLRAACMILLGPRARPASRLWLETTPAHFWDQILIPLTSWAGELRMKQMCVSPSCEPSAGWWRGIWSTAVCWFRASALGWPQHMPSLSEAYLGPFISRREGSNRKSWRARNCRCMSGDQLPQALPSSRQQGTCKPSASA